MAENADLVKAKALLQQADALANEEKELNNRVNYAAEELGKLNAGK